MSCILLLCFLTFLFLPILTANSLIFPYALTPFDICKIYPETWYFLKMLYFICFIFSYLIIYIYIVINISKYKKAQKTFETTTLDTSKVHLKIGKTENNTTCYIDEKRIIPKYFSYWNYW